MSVIRWWGYFLWVGDRGVGVGGGVPLVYECCKMVVGTSCGLGVGGWGVPLVYECCKMVCGTSCGLGVGGWGVPLVYECCKIVGVCPFSV